MHPFFFPLADPSTVKLPGVVLLGYPLRMALNYSALRNNVERYANLTHSSDTSVMAWAMFAINWLQLDDIQHAENAFKNSYLSVVKEPFKVNLVQRFSLVRIAF